MAARTGTQLFAKATIADDTIPAQVADQSEINGGWHSVSDIAARDATALQYRRWGMVVNVENDTDVANNKQWILTRPSSGITDDDAGALMDNGNWVALNTGAGTVVAENGLTFSNGAIQLGGTLSNTSFIYLNNNALLVRPSSGQQGGSLDVTPAGTSLTFYNSSGQINSVITSGNNSASMSTGGTSIDLDGTSTYITSPNLYLSLLHNSDTTKVLTTDSNGKLSLTSISPAWNLTGNTGTTPGTNFIGTTDNVGLLFKANNQKSGSIDIASQSTSFGYLTITSPYYTGTNNSAFGNSCLSNIRTGYGNSAFGAGTLNSLTTGHDNVAIGQSVLNSSLSASISYNTVVGSSSATSLSSGLYNTIIGAYAFNAASSNESYNTSLGYNTLYNLLGANYNTALGYSAGLNLTSGSFNVILGASIDVTNPTGDNQLAIGSNGNIWISGNNGTITIPNLAGTGDRMVTVDSNGTLTATLPSKEPFVTNSTTIAAIIGAAYNTGNSYTATLPLTGNDIFNQGQLYKSGAYLYMAIADNASIRIPLG